MKIEIFLIGLGVCSAFTALVTEAVKKLLKEAKKKYHNNALAAICSIIVAVVVAVSYVIIKGIPFDAALIVEILLLTILSWLCSMVGYDKVKQTVEQYLSTNK